MNKDYQKKLPVAPDAIALIVPEHVTVAMAEIAEDMREGLLALAVRAGLQVMSAIFEADVTALAGVKGKHDSDRIAVRHGHERGSVTLGGRRVPVERPRVRAVDGSGELAVPAYELFSSTEILGQMAMEANARGAVDSPLLDRPGASRAAGHRGRDRHQPVGGVTEVRSPDPDRPG